MNKPVLLTFASRLGLVTILLLLAAGLTQAQTPTSDVQVTKAVDKLEANNDDILNYTLSYSNAGTASATNTILSDVIPTGAGYVLNSATGNATWTGTELRWNLGTLAPGANGSVTFQVRVGATNPPAGSGTVYRVGPGRQYTQITQVATLLNPGDVVEVDGNTTYNAVRFTRAGNSTAPITLRGIRVNGVRPTIAGDIDPVNAPYALYFQSPSGQTVQQNGYYNVEGFEITSGSGACIRNQARDIVYRDIKVYNCPRHGLLSHDYNSGNLTISHAEFTGIGGTYAGENVKHPVYITTSQDTHPGSKCRVEFSYIHHNNSGNNIKSRCERNEIYYNWIEGADVYEIELIGGEESNVAGTHSHSDVVGNVLWGHGGQVGYIMRFGSDGHSDTLGRYRLVNNTIVTDAAGFGGIMRHGGAIEAIEMYNNVIHDLAGGVNGPRLHRADGTWVYGEVCTGANNWITNGFSTTQSGSACGAVLATAIRGANPGFTNTSSPSTFDPRPAVGSPLINAGTTTTTGSNSYPLPNPLVQQRYLPPLRASADFLSRIPTLRTNVGLPDIGAFETL